MYVCRVDTPSGTKDYVTLIAPDVAFSRGLAPEAIVGVLLRPLKPEESITPEVFARNRIFVDFLHEVIARYGPDQPGCQTEAIRLGDGWIYIIDQRTPTPEGPVPPEDIVGALEVKDGNVVPGSYRASTKHMILASNGFFRLDGGLQQCLLRELASRNAQAVSQHGRSLAACDTRNGSTHGKITRRRCETGSITSASRQEVADT